MQPLLKILLLLAAFILPALSLPVYAQADQKGVWNAGTGNSSRTGSSSQGYPATQARQTVNSHSPSAPAAGKAVPPGSAGKLLDYRETVDGRNYMVHLPHNYGQLASLPVVFVFHGLGMSGTLVRGMSAMDLTAETNGFITVYPDALGGRWNDGIQGDNGADDVRFVVDMLDSMSHKFKIDRRHVYACGISNGGYMVERLACEIPDRIAAIGVVAASASKAVCSRCNARRGMPVVFFLGTEDPLLVHEGESKELGKLGDALGLSDLGIKHLDSTIAGIAGVMSAAEAPEFWVRNNGASQQPRQETLPDTDSRDGCRVKRETFGGGNEVVVYTVEGGGHSWPGGFGHVAQDVIGKTTNDINASDLMWQFFRNHSR